MKEFWNERFGREEFIYGKEPNSFFKTEMEKLDKKGKALFPMEGEGRNACFAAERGWEVDAFDFSEAGKKKAEELSQLKRVSISYKINKVEDYHFIEGKYDLIVLIYAHLNPELRKYLHTSVIKSLKPGGKLILESFHPKQLKENYTSGGPKSLDMLYDCKTMEHDFKELSKVTCEEIEIDLKEGQFHLGKAYVTRCIGVK
jgi:SAM-dependent methyltransferase